MDHLSAVFPLGSSAASATTEISFKLSWHRAHHHRCYRNKATEQFLIAGPGGTSFLDWKRGGIVNHDWIRGLCQYGIMPANGLLYVTPHPCGCYADLTFNGLNAFGSGSITPGHQNVPIVQKESLAVINRKKKAKTKTPEAWKAPVYGDSNTDWPTYRHDISRSGSTPTRVPVALQKIWACSLGGTITSPTMKDGRVYVACLDNNTVNCIDANTGRFVWSYIAGGPVDSPPTIYGSTVLFGCRDGSVYALRAHDGSLVWRFEVPQTQRYMLNAERIESTWPVHGSVLLLNDTVYGVAGRSSVLDGGILLFGLNASDGTVVHMKRMFSTGESAAKNALQTDILISDGDGLVMRNFRFTPSLEYPTGVSRHNTINCPVGIMESVWGHRSNWCLGGREPNSFLMNLGISQVSASRPFGKLIVFDDKTAYFLQSLYTFRKLDVSQYPPSHTGPKHQHYYRYREQDFPIGCRLAAQDNKIFPIRNRGRNGFLNDTSGHTWHQDMPLQLRSMVLADTTIFVAGWEDRVNTKGKPEQEDRVIIQARAAGDGKLLSEIDIPAKPVYDGLIAANGRLYISLANGQILCLGE
jgi:outer membrane protein assembly factor BamB